MEKALWKMGQESTPPWPGTLPAPPSDSVSQLATWACQFGSWHVKDEFLICLLVSMERGGVRCEEDGHSSGDVWITLRIRTSQTLHGTYTKNYVMLLSDLLIYGAILHFAKSGACPLPCGTVLLHHTRQGALGTKWNKTGLCPQGSHSLVQETRVQTDFQSWANSTLTTRGPLLK